MILLPIIIGVVVGIVWYNLMINERGKYGIGDTFDKVMSIMMGFCGFLASWAFLFSIVYSK